MSVFEVTMKEVNCDHEIVQLANCENREQVIKWYGLNEPDIEYYHIREIPQGN